MKPMLKRGLNYCRALLSVRIWAPKFYLRPRTKTALRAPISINSCDSSFVKQPHWRIKSTKQTAIQPSTFKMRFGFWIWNFQIEVSKGRSKTGSSTPYQNSSNGGQLKNPDIFGALYTLRIQYKYTTQTQCEDSARDVKVL